jgi:hypothetical protein
MLQEKDLYWLAGILEGEGYFYSQTDKYPLGIAVEMTDLDIIERICKLLKTKYCCPKKREEHHKQSYKVVLRGKKAIAVMILLLPMMGERRSEKIRECIQFHLEKEVGRNNRIEEIKKLRNEGVHPKDIAKIYGISHWRVYQITR